jgi:hypothetical protein
LHKHENPKPSAIVAFFEKLLSVMHIPPLKHGLVGIDEQFAGRHFFSRFSGEHPLTTLIKYTSQQISFLVNRLF